MAPKRIMKTKECSNISTSFLLIIWFLLQQNGHSHGKSISNGTGYIEDQNQFLKLENSTEIISIEQQVGIQYEVGFCGFKTPQMNEINDADSEEDLPKNQTLRRTRRFLSDFFGYQYRLKKWSKNTITWRLSNRNLRNLNYNNVREILFKAFKIWSDVVPLTFREMNSSLADIQISFESGDHNCEDSFDGAGNKLAHAYGPGSGILGDIHFDADENWILSNDHSPFSWILFRRPSLLNVAIHEIGHALGLDHSETKESIMYGKYNHVEILHKDDREAIQKLYPKTDTGRTFTAMKPTRRCTFCEYAFCGCRRYCDICALSSGGYRILIL